MKLALQLVANLTLIASAGCIPAASHDEVARVPSPDGRIDAVLFEINGGATTSFDYEVELDTKQGNRAKVASLYGAVRNAQAYGVDLHWDDNHTLVIECLKTEAPPHIKDLVAVGDRDVHVLLHTGVEDKKAQSGGMLYNLRKH
jgi:hypothetical protein